MVTYLLLSYYCRLPVRRREKHHLFVADKRDCEAICNEVVDSLDEFLRLRFSIDDVVISNLVSITHFHADVDLRAVHESVASDMDVAALIVIEIP